MRKENKFSFPSRTQWNRTDNEPMQIFYQVEKPSVTNHGEILINKWIFRVELNNILSVASAHGYRLPHNIA